MQRTDYTPFLGGLDLVTPPISLPPGRAIAALNYEPDPAGYARIEGFERFDGRPAPSAASYWLLNFDAGVAAVTEGQTVTGASSGATGVALVDAVVTSGSYGGSDAAGYLVLTSVSGEFINNENLQVSAVTVSVADGDDTERGASNDTDDQTWLQDAIETARSAIGAVNGSGPIRGIWLHKAVVYAFRDNAGGTAGQMHKSSASGWSVVDLGREIDFDAGTAEFAEGETLTGGTSGATATIKRIIVESGDWSTNDADGYLILASVVGTFQNNETITSASGSATADGADAAIALPAGGTYEFRDHNFYGASDLLRIYGVNGVGRGFEFDGTVFVPIRTGMSSDIPTHMAIHKKHLFFSFNGGSLQHSALGNPYSWSPILGAAEIGMGEDVTNLLESTAGPMTVLTRQKRAVLYGNDSDDWSLDELGDDSGGIPYTAQNIGGAVFMDQQGVRRMEPTESFGSFRMGTLTQYIEPLLRAKWAAGTVPTVSVRVRAKDQYRIFFDDKSGLTLYFGHTGNGEDGIHGAARHGPEILPFNYDKVVRCAASCECVTVNPSGEEKLFFGSDDGFVYQLDQGTSFDGQAVDAFLRIPFNHIGSPTQNKVWKQATLELNAAANTELGMVAEFAYADPDQPPAEQQDFSVKGGGGFWDEANWDEFYWSSPVYGTATADIEGFGPNVGIGIISQETYNKPHVLSGITLHYTLRGLKRGA